MSVPKTPPFRKSLSFGDFNYILKDRVDDILDIKMFILE